MASETATANNLVRTSLPAESVPNGCGTEGGFWNTERSTAFGL